MTTLHTCMHPCSSNDQLSMYVTFFTMCSLIGSQSNSLHNTAVCLRLIPSSPSPPLPSPPSSLLLALLRLSTVCRQLVVGVSVFVRVPFLTNIVIIVIVVKVLCVCVHVRACVCVCVCVCVCMCVRDSGSKDRISCWNSQLTKCTTLVYRG